MHVRTHICTHSMYSTRVYVYDICVHTHICTHTMYGTCVYVYDICTHVYIYISLILNLNHSFY